MSTSKCQDLYTPADDRDAYQLPDKGVQLSRAKTLLKGTSIRDAFILSEILKRKEDF